MEDQMKEKLLILSFMVAFSACAPQEKDACLDLRIGMKKAEVERRLGAPRHISKGSDDDRLYRNVDVYSYTNKGPFAEDDVIFIANKEDEVIDISCEDRPVNLHVDGTRVDEFYIHRWRIDKNPPANKKVTPPQ